MKLIAGERLERGQAVGLGDDGKAHPWRQGNEPAFTAPCAIEKDTAIELQINADGSKVWLVDGREILAKP